jgi:hypothetical protein
VESAAHVKGNGMLKLPRYFLKHGGQLAEIPHAQDGFIEHHLASRL